MDFPARIKNYLISRRPHHHEPINFDSLVLRWANKIVLKSKLSASFVVLELKDAEASVREMSAWEQLCANKRHNTNGIIKFICAENGQFLPKDTWYQNWYWQKGYNDKCYENRLFIIRFSFVGKSLFSPSIVHFWPRNDFTLLQFELVFNRVCRVVDSRDPTTNRYWLFSLD